MIRERLLKYLIAAGILAAIAIPGPAYAASGLKIEVDVIQALTEEGQSDPELADLGRELGPVFTFKSFRLIKQNILKLRENEQIEVLLADNRVLELHLAGFTADHQARLVVRILKDKKQIFHTTLLMVDQGSAIIGGPPLKKGVMLLRIIGAFISQPDIKATE